MLIYCVLQYTEIMILFLFIWVFSIFSYFLSTRFQMEYRTCHFTERHLTQDPCVQALFTVAIWCHWIQNDLMNLKSKSYGIPVNVSKHAWLECTRKVSWVYADFTDCPENNWLFEFLCPVFWRDGKSNSNCQRKFSWRSFDLSYSAPAHSCLILMVSDRTERNWGPLLTMIKRGSLGIIREVDDATGEKAMENREGIPAGPCVERWVQRWTASLGFRGRW